MYENLLREYDCRITVPYWDWATNSDIPYQHPVWDDVNGFGNSSRSSDNCVDSGPFSHDKFQLPAQAAISGDTKSKCLKRQYNMESGYPSWNAVLRFLQSSHYCVSPIYTALLDMKVTSLVGGHMDTINRVFDPLYPLHLSFLAYLSELWRNLHFVETEKIFQNLLKSFTDGIEPPKMAKASEYTDTGLIIHYESPYFIPDFSMNRH